MPQTSNSYFLLHSPKHSCFKDGEFNKEKKDVKKKKSGFSLSSAQALPRQKMENWALFVGSFNCMTRGM